MEGHFKVILQSKYFSMIASLCKLFFTGKGAKIKKTVAAWKVENQSKMAVVKYWLFEFNGPKHLKTICVIN